MCFVFSRKDLIVLFPGKTAWGMPQTSSNHLQPSPEGGANIIIFAQMTSLSWQPNCIKRMFVTVNKNNDKKRVTYIVYFIPKIYKYIHEGTTHRRSVRFVFMCSDSSAEK